MKIRKVKKYLAAAVFVVGLAGLGINYLAHKRRDKMVTESGEPNVLKGITEEDLV